MPFEFERLEIPDVILVKPRVFEDERGFFMETYKKPDFAKAGIDVEFVQENHSYSTYGVLRGLHFQRKPYAQSKLVRCVRGKIFDVAVDIRRDSPTFSKYVAVELSAENKHMLFVPQGFAHGFLVVSEEAEVTYIVDNIYSGSHEEGIIWNDQTLHIKWPIIKPILSEKDENLPPLEKRC